MNNSERGRSTEGEGGIKRWMDVGEGWKMGGVDGGERRRVWIK